MPVVATAVPSLSQIHKWDTTYLASAARNWQRTAARWEDELTGVYRGVTAPGGTVWEGEAADAAVQRAHHDRMTAIRLADTLRDTAKVATAGMGHLETAKRRALYAIADAEGAGFVVQEDLSLLTVDESSSPAELAVRIAVAEQFAAEIHRRALELKRLDTEVASNLSVAGSALTEELDQSGDGSTQVLAFGPVPAAPIPDPGIPDQPVGRGPGPAAAEIREVVNKLPEGNNPRVREVRSPQDLQNLWKWLTQNGIDRQVAYDTTSGTSRRLPDGTIVGQRDEGKSSGRSVLDIKIPGEPGNIKVHVNPRGGVPELPGVPRATSPEVPVRAPAPVEPPLVRGGLPVGGPVAPDNGRPLFVEPDISSSNEPPVIGDGKPDGPAP